MDADIKAAAESFQQRNPGRADKRGCPDCKKKMLARMKADSCPDNPTALHVCPAHKLIVSPRICKQCKRFPAFRDSLSADYIRNRAMRGKPCKWAGEPVSVEQVKHDGGYTTDISLYACALHRKVYAIDCHVCKDYQF